MTPHIWRPRWSKYGIRVLFSSSILFLLLTLQYHRPSIEIASSPSRSREARSTNAWPKAAWLVSYPNSGGNYLTSLVRSVSQKTTATNYGDRTSEGSTEAYGPNGPYRFTTDLPFPERYILTETHCAGFGIDPASYEFDRDAFVEGCASGVDPQSGREVRYEHGILGRSKFVEKQIHLIRNPLDNLVAIFGDEYLKNGGESSGGSFDRGGFLEFCRALDLEFALRETKWKENVVALLAKDVPCHGLLYQYITWHNKFYDVTNQYGHLQSFVDIHYEDFRDDLEGTISTVTDFLELPLVTNSAPPFFFVEYRDYFSHEEQIAIASLLKVTACQKAWVQIKRYLPSPVLENAYEQLGEILSPVYFGSWPSVAWLLSYPNSGTFFTTQLTQLRSRCAIATNYAVSVGEQSTDIPNFARTSNGPFRFSNRPFPSTFILTSTHCGGHCSECSPFDYTMGPSKFLHACATGGGGSHRYDPSIAKKVVHLVRDPFDNIVARFHYAYKDHKKQSDPQWTYSYNQQGFRRWCEDLDTRYQADYKRTYDTRLLQLSNKIPCHGEFYQYILWHNNAFTLPHVLSVPPLVLHYQDYQNLDASATALFSFLELPLVGKVTPFSFNGYPHYFLEEERQAVRLFFQEIASKETLEETERYF